MAEQDTQSHDIFVSYVDADREWVAGVLLHAFERAGVRYIDEASFALGTPRLVNFQKAVTSSARSCRDEIDEHESRPGDRRRQV